ARVGPAGGDRPLGRSTGRAGRAGGWSDIAVRSRLRRSRPLAPRAARHDRSHAAASALCAADRAAALRALHAGDGRADLRHAAREVHPGRGNAARELRPRPDERVRLRGRVDAAHERCADDLLRRAAPAPARHMGRPGGGIMALRGHAAIQGSTDVPTLYHSIHGYMSAPSALKQHDTLEDYLRTETSAGGYWANTPKFMVSYLKSFYGDAATPANDFGYDWHPKILGDHSHMAMFSAMADGNVRGMLCVGQNPATSLNARLEREGLRRLEWLVVKDNWLTETATHWYAAPEVQDGSIKVEDIQTEVFFFPSTQIAEYDGSFTNTQRMLQW